MRYCRILLALLSKSVHAKSDVSVFETREVVKHERNIMLMGRAGRAGGLGGARPRLQCAPEPVRHSTSARQRNNTTQYYTTIILIGKTPLSLPSVISKHLRAVPKVLRAFRSPRAVSECLSTTTVPLWSLRKYRLSPSTGSSLHPISSSHFRGCLAEIRRHLDRVTLLQHVSYNNAIDSAREDIRAEKWNLIKKIKP